MQPVQRLPNLAAVDHQLEGAARDKDRVIAVSQIQVLHLLQVEMGSESALRRKATAHRQHIRRRIDPIDLQARCQVGDQQAARSTTDIQSRTSVLFNDPLKEALIGTGFVN
jgi:hypothetical protein